MHRKFDALREAELLDMAEDFLDGLVLGTEVGDAEEGVVGFAAAGHLIKNIIISEINSSGL